MPNTNRPNLAHAADQPPPPVGGVFFIYPQKSLNRWKCASGPNPRE